MTLNTLTDYEITMTLIALGCLMLGAFICGKLFDKINAPKVVGEIIGGMLFGGTILGHFFPQFIDNVFMSYSEQGKVLNLFYQMGLIFLMFTSGYNTKIDLQKKNMKLFSSLFVGATIIPMLLGIIFINPFKQYFIGDAGNQISYSIVFLIAISITSIPVISKIFFDMGIINTPFANVVLTASTLQDLCLWILLNTAINLAVSKEIDYLKMIITVIITIILFVGTRFLGKIIHKIKFEFKDGAAFLQLCFICLFFFIAALSFLKINIMYSSFLVGYLMRCITNKENNVNERVQCISDFSFSFFVPVYFALVGIQLNLIHHFSIVRFVLFFIVAFILEGIGTVVVLKLTTKLNNNKIINFGVAMNARGGPGIVLATVAYNYKIINIEFFTVLVLTTMLSSLIAGYWLRRQQRKYDNIFEL